MYKVKYSDDDLSLIFQDPMIFALLNSTEDDEDQKNEMQFGFLKKYWVHLPTIYTIRWRFGGDQSKYITNISNNNRTIYYGWYRIQITINLLAELYEISRVCVKIEM